MWTVVQPWCRRIVPWTVALYALLYGCVARYESDVRYRPYVARMLPADAPNLQPPPVRLPVLQEPAAQGREQDAQTPLPLETLRLLMLPSLSPAPASARGYDYEQAIDAQEQAYRQQRRLQEQEQERREQQWEEERQLENERRMDR